MEITEIFYPENRLAWQNWLAVNHQQKEVIWVQKYRKDSGKPSIDYDDLVEVCLCYGWIDGVVKKNCPEGHVQRITPRRKNSFLSELNRQRIWKLEKQGLMTDAAYVHLDGKIGSPDEILPIPDWASEQMQADEDFWTKFQVLPHFYKRLKIGWIAEPGKSEKQRAVAQKRLDYFIKMTKKGKKYGTQPLEHLDSAMTNK